MTNSSREVQGRAQSCQPLQTLDCSNNVTCRYESIIATLCENLETLDEPEAKASMIWIIGEYAERIDNADELLEFFLETFPEESSQVQLQLITAAVKLFLKKPTARPQQMIQLVLTYATQVINKRTQIPQPGPNSFICIYGSPAFTGAGHQVCVLQSWHVSKLSSNVPQHDAGDR